MLHELNVIYQPGQKKHWEGRKSNTAIGNQYWHEEIKLCDFRDYTTENASTFALVGYACDEGVRRNLGRVGASKGPTVLREKLAKLPIHFDSKYIIDFGDVMCIDDDMESCQKAFTQIIEQLILQDIFPIGIGGGHDMAYAHFMGIYQAIKHRPKNKIGIINFDAHFDLRPVDGKPNSGTPFNQIFSELSNSNDQFDYCAIGIQQQSNTKELFQIAKEHNVISINNFECESTFPEMQALQQKLSSFIESNDYLYITVDLDGLSSAFAPGVSAPSPLGFTPHFLYKMLRFLFNSQKVISFDIAELNPTVDADNLTAGLAAKLVDYVVSIK